MRSTSLEAYASIKAFVTPIRAQVLAELRRAKKGLTDEQLCDRLLLLNPSSVRTRRRELVDSGLVVEASAMGTTQSGRKAIVWKAA